MLQEETKTAEEMVEDAEVELMAQEKKKEVKKVTAGYLSGKITNLT